MKSFTGAALYSAKEIFRALDSYQKEVIWADGLLKSKIKEAEESLNQISGIKFSVGSV